MLLCEMEALPHPTPRKGKPCDDLYPRMILDLRSASTARAPKPTLSGTGKEALCLSPELQPQAPSSLFAWRFLLACWLGISSWLASSSLRAVWAAPELGKPEALFGTTGGLRGPYFLVSGAGLDVGPPPSSLILHYCSVLCWDEPLLTGYHGPWLSWVTLIRDPNSLVPIGFAEEPFLDSHI